MAKNKHTEQEEISRITNLHFFGLEFIEILREWTRTSDKMTNIY